MEKELNFKKCEKILIKMFGKEAKSEIYYHDDQMIISHIITIKSLNKSLLADIYLFKDGRMFVTFGYGKVKNKDNIYTILNNVNNKLLYGKIDISDDEGLFYDERVPLVTEDQIETIFNASFTTAFDGEIIEMILPLLRNKR